VKSEKVKRFASARAAVGGGRARQPAVDGVEEAKTMKLLEEELDKLEML